MLTCALTFFLQKVTVCSWIPRNPEPPADSWELGTTYEFVCFRMQYIGFGLSELSIWRQVPLVEFRWFSWFKSVVSPLYSFHPFNDSFQLWSISLLYITDIRKSILLFLPESENEPNRTELKLLGSVRVDPNRTRTEFLKIQSNRTEPEPVFQKWSRTEPNSNRLFGNSVEPNRTNFKKTSAYK